MTQALYAHMSNKMIKIFKKRNKQKKTKEEANVKEGKIFHASGKD
jgi:hypothetical protein